MSKGFKKISSTSIRDYFSLTKPGVLFANALTAGAGFLFASKGTINFLLFACLFIGSTLIIASACVLNNVLDQDIDSQMTRTKNRAMVLKTVPRNNALVFSFFIGIIGLIILYVYTNILVVSLGIIGFIDYVLLYGMLSKRLSWHGTLVGSISGAVPIISGYVAVTRSIDMTAVFLFMVMFFWQMPEFYSIAIYRMKEYKSAKIPVITVVKGIPYAQKLIFVYTILFVVSALLITFIGDTSAIYRLIMIVLGVRWIVLSWNSFRASNIELWAKNMFRFSLYILLTFCLLISIDAWLR